MDVKLALLLSCLIATSYCRSNIPSRNDVTYEHEMCAGMTSEMRSIRQLLMNLQIQQQNRPREECPFGFDYLPEAGSCYSIIFEEMTWGRATDRCRGIMPGAHLAAITSQEEHDAVTSYIRSKFNSTAIRSSATADWCDGGYLLWMSGQSENANCPDSFAWKALNGIEVPFNYTNWGSGEPNCAGNEFCVHMASCKDLAWNDYSCSRMSFPLCEI